MTASFAERIRLTHGRLLKGLGDCHCSICQEPVAIKQRQDFNTQINFEAAVNPYLHVGETPPIAPYGGKPGTRIGSFKTLNFWRLRFWPASSMELQQLREEVAA